MYLNTHRMHCSVSTATMVTGMRHNVTLYVHDLCYSVLALSFKLLPIEHIAISVTHSMLSHSPLHFMV